MQDALLQPDFFFISNLKRKRRARMCVGKVGNFIGQYRLYNVSSRLIPVPCLLRSYNKSIKFLGQEQLFCGEYVTRTNLNKMLGSGVAHEKFKPPRTCGSILYAKRMSPSRAEACTPEWALYILQGAIDAPPINLRTSQQRISLNPNS